MLAARFDRKHAVFYARILRASLRVKLLLSIAPAVAAYIVAPARRVRQPRVIKFVRSHEPPACIGLSWVVKTNDKSNQCKPHV